MAGLVPQLDVSQLLPAEGCSHAADLINHYRMKEHRQLVLNDPATSPRSTASSPRELVPSDGSMAVPPWTREMQAFRQARPSTTGTWRTPNFIWPGCVGGPQPAPSSFNQDRARRFLGEKVALTRNYSPVHVQAYPYCPDYQDRSLDVNRLSGIAHADQLAEQDPYWLRETLTYPKVLGTGHIKFDHTGKNPIEFVRTGSPAAVQSGYQEDGLFYPERRECAAIQVRQPTKPREVKKVPAVAPLWDRVCTTSDDAEALTVYNVSGFSQPTCRYQYDSVHQQRPKPAKHGDPMSAYERVYSDKQEQRFHSRQERADVVRRQTENLYQATA